MLILKNTKQDLRKDKREAIRSLLVSWGHHKIPDAMKGNRRKEAHKKRASPMPSRDKYDIFSDILKATSHRDGGSRITEVTKEASLNMRQAKEVIMDMLEIGLLDFNTEDKTLRTSAKGWRFQMIYKELIEFMPIAAKVL